MMDDFVKKFDVKTLKKINQCRLYLKVNLLSEIVTMDGTTIKKEIYNVTQPTQSTLKWPIQHKPGPNSIKAWQNAIDTLCNEQRQLHDPLGHWSVTPEQKLSYFENIKIVRQLNETVEITNSEDWDRPVV